MKQKNTSKNLDKKDTHNKKATKSGQIFRNFRKFSLGLSVGVASLFFIGSLQAAQNQKHVAITQITSHEALDKVHEGTIEGLRQSGYIEGENLKVTFSNANGDISIANQIATRFVELHPDAIVAIATPSAQACILPAAKNNIPLVFATVTDPIEAKLVPDLVNKPKDNVTGTINTSPIAEILSMIREVLPKISKLGLIINYSEPNSVNLLKQVESLAQKDGIKVVVASADTSASVADATSSLIGKVDALLLLQDNTVASALPGVISITNAHKVPVFSTYDEAAKKGALLGLAFNEFEIGVQTGKLTAKILDGSSAASLPVELPKALELSINLTTAEKLGIPLPQRILDQVNLRYPDSK